jgi:hypothetical protein
MVESALRAICLLVIGAGCAAAGRDQKGVELSPQVRPTAGDDQQIGLVNRDDDTAGEARFTGALETVADSIGALQQQVETVNNQVGANSGDNWTTRLFVIVVGGAVLLVGATMVAGFVWVIVDRRRYHKKCTYNGARASPSRDGE